MTLKRHKHCKKVLAFYRNNFNLIPPYHVLVDGTFCKAALNSQVNIMEQLPKYLDGEVKLSTTKCVLKECEALGSLLYGPLKVLQQYGVQPCGHRPVVLPARCIAKLAKNQGKHKYFVATQDRELTEKLASVPGIPLLYISHGAILLEAPSNASQQHVKDKLVNMVAPTQKQQETLEKLNREAFGEPEPVKQRKRKGPKGPNPLSCKKKKKNAAEKEPSQTQSAKRKRKRHRRNKNSTLTAVTS